MKYRAELDARDMIEVEMNEQSSQQVKVHIVGCSDFMEMMQKMRRHFGNQVNQWPLPEGKDHSSLLLKEMILKLRGEWNFPYEHEELCHCRSVSAHTVDQAVIAGAHTPEVVSRQTSASTACGTCRPEVEKIINYRTGKAS